MATLIHILLTIAIVFAALFVLSFIIYFFNLDMKFVALVEPLLTKYYDKMKKDKKK